MANVDVAAGRIAVVDRAVTASVAVGAAVLPAVGEGDVVVTRLGESLASTVGRGLVTTIGDGKVALAEGTATVFSIAVLGCVAVADGASAGTVSESPAIGSAPMVLSNCRLKKSAAMSARSDKAATATASDRTPPISLVLNFCRSRANNSVRVART